MTNFTRYSSAFSNPEGWMDASCTALVNFITTEARNLNTDDRIICTRLAVSHNAVFKRLTIHVYQNLRAGRGNEEDLQKLKDCISTWSSWDAMTSLIHHKDISDRLRSFSGQNGDTQARKLVALDVDALCINLLTIIRNHDDYKVLGNLKDENAQKILDLLQTLVDSPFLDSQFRIPFVSALLRLSKKSCFVPRTLVQNPVIHGDYSVAEGASGKVYTGTYRGGAVAVKLLQGYLKTGSEERLKAIINEALIWHQLQHSNVLPFLCLCYYGDKSHTQVGLVSPWMENGNVQEYLRRVPSTDRISLILDVLRGLEYLHSMKPIIIHGDLKTVNILVTNTRTACLADFGLSRVLDSQIVKFSSWTVDRRYGTLRWMAPELFTQDDEHEVPVNTATDMYAVGCVCYEIFSGRIPFENIRIDVNVVPIVITGRRPPRPDHSEPSKKTCRSLGLSDSVWRVVEQCWKADPKQRPTAKEAIQRLPTTATALRRRPTGTRRYTPASNADENIVSWAMAHFQTKVNRRKNTL